MRPGVDRGGTTKTLLMQIATHPEHLELDTARVSSSQTILICLESQNAGTFQVNSKQIVYVCDATWTHI